MNGADMTASSALRVLIADDHPLFRDGLARRIHEHPDLELAGEASHGQQALALMRELAPDVAVLDLKMPRLDGIQVCARAAKETPGTTLMVLSAYVESELVFKAIAAGARGFLSKYASREDVLRTVLAVGNGEVVIPRALHGGLAEEIRARGDEARPALSLREFEVLRWIAAGASAPEIGRELHLSAGTVKSHMQHLYGKLGVSDRAAAVAVAMRQGILE
jgi:two-component system, NarL family, nitrate/nitrite response regulator NarL